MSDNAGSYIGGILDAVTTPTGTKGGNTGSVIQTGVIIGENAIVYLNQAWYATGSIYESWITVGAPSTFNSATGHGPSVLSEFQHRILRT